MGAQEKQQKVKKVASAQAAVVSVGVCWFLQAKSRLAFNGQKSKEKRE